MADVEFILLALRVAAGLLLLSFLGATFYLMWRDFRAVSAEVTARNQRRGSLRVVGGDGLVAPAGANFSLLALTRLGRAPTNTICLDDTFASLIHATVTLRGGQWWLEDRNSSNGTRLNGVRITEPVVLSAGDIIGIGRTELKLELA